ncbi:hypothetical protein C823_001738 [Eubacterium plexicaudatum ASF492]|uniref:HTH rpiR-type domain-containing protein n=1 Tax=Eubacterium plexicaudatum ASF492 TaxID=1235802 RepID=N2B9D2_9FIRM|nr:hypothetical protein C823_001738 [Eubacterium plexicaudatum ASF492]
MAIRDAKSMGSIADLLLNYVSTASVHDTNYEIALGMIQNYSRLYKKSCEEVAEICFVSKASVSRFCKFIGYTNYKEFQEALSFNYEMGSQYTKNFKTMLKTDKQQAMESYRDALVSNIYSTLSEEMLVQTEEIAEILYESENIAYFSHQFLWDIGRFFQSKMMLMNKYVKQFMYYGAQLECASNLSPRDVVVICSVQGTYPYRYNVIWNEIVSRACKIIVITQNVESSYWNQADYIISCGKTSVNDTGKYSALMVMDMLLIHYMSKYCNGKTDED